jgi:Tol biopolymer transport system component
MNMNRLFFAAGFVAVMLASLSADERQARVLMQAAEARATVHGDLKGAIQIYETVLKEAGSNRALAAGALLRIAECHQKLGSEESRTVYERVIRDYADQAESVAVARARLGARGIAPTAAPGMVARQLWTSPGYVQATIASDGRTLAVTESRPNDIQIRDLTKGVVTRLKVTADPQSAAYGEWPVLSPDLESVAYAFAGPETGWAYQLRITGVQSDAKAMALGDTFPYLYVQGWSPDAKSVLANLAGGEGQASRIVWISTSNGSIKQLKSVDWQSPGRLALSPDGTFIAYSAQIEPNRSEREIRLLASDGSGESTVVHAPGINRSPVWSRDGSRIVFISNRSGTLGIWSVAVRNGRAEGAPAPVKTDTGDIDLIGFTADDTLLYQHRISTKDVFAMDLDAAAGKLRGSAVRLVDTFEGWNWNPSVSPDGKSIAYLSRRPGAGRDSANIVVRPLAGGAERVIPTAFPVGGGGGGVPVWLPDGRTLIQPGRNNQNRTVLYRVDVPSGQVTMLIDTGSQGPTRAAVSPDGRTVYTSADVGTCMCFVAYDIATGRRTDFSHPGDAKGIAASPDGRAVAFVTWESDRTPTRVNLFLADADGRNPRVILTSDKRDEIPSAGGIAWSPDGRFVYFGTQFPGGVLWRIGAAGGAPMLVGELTKDRLHPINITADGRQIVFGNQGNDRVEIWALENIEPLARSSR